MDDECCVMEEKSLFNSFHAEGRMERNDDLNKCNKKNEELSESAWLPDGLRRRINESFENIQEKQCYPIVDWLKEIRLSCDLYDVGLPNKDDFVEAVGTSNEEKSSIVETDDSEIENIGMDERESEFSHIDRENLFDIRNECYPRADNELLMISEAEDERNEVTQSCYDYSCENYEFSMINEEATTVSSIYEQSNKFESPIEMTNSSNNTCSFELQLENDMSFDFNRFNELSSILFCNDDHRAIKYCDWYLKHGNVLFNDFSRSNSQLDSINSQQDKETTNVDDESLQCASLDLDLSEIDDTLIATNLDNDIHVSRRNDKAFYETEDSPDALPKINWMESFNDFDRSDDVVRNAELEGRIYDDFNEHDDNKYLDCKPRDITIINENLNGDFSKIREMPVNHWIETFNNLNEPNESAQYTERIHIEKFNIFHDTKNDNSEETCELCDEQSKSHSNPWGIYAGVYCDKSIKEFDNLNEYRRRKGSVSSDIIAWKRNLFNEFLDDEETGDQWFSSNDAEGKIYFFEENSNESSWVLPTLQAEKSISISEDGKDDRIDINDSSTSYQKENATRTSILTNPNNDLSTKKPASTSGDWPHLYDGNNMLVLKEGIINRTKITENGKKLRKNWSTSYAVLTELFLLFFKDVKTFTMMKMGQSSMAKPDISVDLNGAIVEHGDRASSRKNVYMISTVLGLQVLIQSDNTAVATEWFQEVYGAIRKLPSGLKSQGRFLSIATELRNNSSNKDTADSNQTEEPKRFSKMTRTRSMRMKKLEDSLEDLSVSAAERQTKIKAKLRRFFQRRPTVELLVKNGIYKDEPAFGSYLSDVCPTEAPRVPLFVKTCIEVLESKEENMKTDGLYRASGNLSQIQKIRLQIDQYKFDVLAQEEDVHVLAGALKLFFRELKEPLIPSTFFKEAVNASMLKKSSAKIQGFKDIVKALPLPNYDTLQYLLQHLLRVTSYQEFNRMHIPNLAIVFGPTLMWPAEESADMALDFMQQNLVVECLLSEYNKIFK